MQKLPSEAGPGCERWKGFCFSNEDCPAHWYCEGCKADPCCEGCQACAGTCTPVPRVGPLPDACNSNIDCDRDPGGSSFCNLDRRCASSVNEGRCQAKPVSCPSSDMCPEVCGCDGMPYCSECEAHMAGVSVAGPGGCATPPMDCAALNQSYKQAVHSAKSCCATCNMESCTVKVWDQLNTELSCLCETYINGNQQVQQQLKALEQQWVALGCGLGFGSGEPWICDDVYPACPTPTGGICAPDGYCDTLY